MPEAKRLAIRSCLVLNASASDDWQEAKIQGAILQAQGTEIRVFSAIRPVKQLIPLETLGSTVGHRVCGASDPALNAQGRGEKQPCRPPMAIAGDYFWGSNTTVFELPFDNDTHRGSVQPLELTL